MRCVVQRVTRAQVTVTGETVGKIGRGYMVLLGVEEGDEEKDMRYCADKVAGLRMFGEENGRMSLSI